jgi:glucosyl-dolichyl phosphate glucuronosyltransferase
MGSNRSVHGLPIRACDVLTSAVNSPQISVVLCTFNRAASLGKTLLSFTELVLPPGVSWELIIVDNHSTDNTRAIVEEFARTSPFAVRYVFEERQGLSWARNAGITAAKGDIVAFTDDDVIVDPEWLANVKRGFDEYHCAALAGRVIPDWLQPKPDWLEMQDQQAVVHFDLGDEWKEIEIPPLGANFSFRKKVFSTYGKFRTDLGLSGGQRGITCEDTEFGKRLILGGEKVVYSPNAIVHHPVYPHRTTKDFLRTWYYNDGRSAIRAFGWSNGTTCFLGVPRWMYWGVVRNLSSWMLTLNSKRRFQRKLSTYRAMGRIVEARRVARAGQHNLHEPVRKTRKAA